MSKESNSEQIKAADLAALYRREAARLRAEADTLETIEMRIACLDAARRFDELAMATERLLRN